MYPNVPNTEVVAVGPTAIAWLDCASPIAPPEIDRWLVEQERQKAAEIKASARRLEFQRSRMLMRRLTAWDRPFLPDPSNKPAWPPHLCGSLTHKNGHVAVALCPRTTHLSIGLDCEHATRDINHLAEKICTASDIRILSLAAAKHPQTPQGSLIPLVFAAKEALFKCHYPIGSTMFWFHDAEIESIDLSLGQFALRVLVQTSDRTPAGFVTRGHFIRKSASDGDYWLALCSLTSTASATN